ncbi:hypothetical protein ACFV9D_30670 [Streptomyces sp. NPDC059875]
MSRSGESGEWAIFRGQFGSTAQPVKIADVPEPIDGSDDHEITLPRWS